MELRTHRGYRTPVDSFWEHYPDYPEIYDRFALSTLHAARIVHELVDFRDARVLDVASGTGKNAVEHARIARYVVGIEPSSKMRAFAIDRARALGLKNIEFRDGTAEDLSMFADGTFDIAVSMHGAPFPWDKEHRFLREAERVVRQGGWLVLVGTTPGWQPLHGRAVTPVGESAARAPFDVLPQRGFEARDFVGDMDYGTEQEALETFGFIHGPAAIDYILDNKTAHQEWALRIYTKRV